MQIELHDPRPDDMAELARLTAIELRKRGIWASAANVTHIPDPVVIVPFRNAREPRWYVKSYCFYGNDFDNLGPIACADVIQAEEARRAQEWAGDKPKENCSEDKHYCHACKNTGVNTLFIGHNCQYCAWKRKP